ncbi:hypothetical protein CEXT_263331 [Caerostris extrusa]|uniref:Ycf1 n=1 Tax=Caerostris extrusa TaxID=172846 RepID=A0AAV4XSV9_CAEEX|nr:hypothetical protein CEXT_263331 [Caerostris extrusa]
MSYRSTLRPPCEFFNVTRFPNQVKLRRAKTVPRYQSKATNPRSSEKHNCLPFMDNNEYQFWINHLVDLIHLKDSGRRKSFYFTQPLVLVENCISSENQINTMQRDM